MSLTTKKSVQKERLKSAIENGGSSVGKLIQKPRKNDESKIQQSFIRWFSLQYSKLDKLLFAIPNGGKRSKITASIMKSEGQKRGVADLFLSIPRNAPLDNWKKHGLYIETKTDIGKQSKEQKEFQKAVESQGYQYTICRSIEEFIKTINDYL